MKKLITLLIILTCITLQAQNSTLSLKNSTTALLDSAGVFTGTAEPISGYNSINITIRADQSATFKVLFGNTSTITTATAVKTYSFSYTANDTVYTKVVSVDAPYFKIIYTNGAVAQTKFYLMTMLSKEVSLPLDAFGTPKMIIEEFATKFIGETDTLTTRTDTVTVSGSYWAQGEIKADDSIQVAINGSFTTGQILIITETTSVKIPMWDLTTSNKIYIKRYGTAGTPRYYLRLSSK